jgi:hypothetical protein
MDGYGTGQDNLVGYLTFDEDVEAKRKLIAMAKEERNLASYEIKFLRKLWGNMCIRRFTVMEKQIMESLRMVKAKTLAKS